jgi:fibronectin-binding autotransporter adhesin
MNQPVLSLPVKTTPPMKPRFASSLAIHTAFVVTMSAALQAAPVIRATNGDSLNLATAWTDGVAPGASNTATWDAESASANTLGANLTWGALNISGASAAVTLAGPNNLVLSHATAGNTVFNTGANAFTWGAAGVGGVFEIRGAAGTSTTTPGATFSGSGTVTISSTGTKNWSSPASTNGVTHINFTGTLALRGAAIPAVGSLPGNWLAFGGGGGAASDPGIVTQTGSFALDTGDEASCGALILTHGWSGQALKLNRLQGTGSIRADWGLSAGTQTRGIELDQAADTTFSGSLLAHNGSSQRRNIHFVKKGAGTLTLAGAIGTSGGAASLTFDLQEGNIHLGNGGATPTIVGGLDTATATFALAGGTELVINRSGSLTWPYIHSGSGTIRIEHPGAVVALTGNSAEFAGHVVLEEGMLLLGPSLGTATVTAEDGTILRCGLPATAGNSTVGALMLKDGSESDFRLGTSADKITVGNADGLTVPGPGGTHVINLINEPIAGATITLIDYNGTPLTSSEFARFTLGSLPFGSAAYELVNNTANTSIDLKITLEDQLWKGFANGNWDTTTANWALASTPAQPVAFSFDNPVRFDDSALVTNVVIEEFGVAPLSLRFENSTAPYTLTGGEIAGNTALVKAGAAAVTLAQPNTYSGGTQVNAGTLWIGNGGETGDIGGGAVTIAQDATLRFNLAADQLRDYKTTPKMRNVSGPGSIVVDGGFTFFNYTGADNGFNNANSWNNFSGTLSIIGGSEFRTIRNGRSAMGSAQVVLGNATSSGNLAQIEGNWTWTNNLQLVGPANEIRNRSAGAPRSLKLQGVISGSGGLVFADPAGSMTNNQTGVILTGANTLDGTLTINPGVPVRVGGVPGEADINLSGPGTGGSLGSATVINEGTLTFSRSDSHTVTNSISGGGAVYIGLTAGNTEQEMTYSGTASHGGGTTVRAGTLTIAPAGSIAGPSVTVASEATLVVDGSSIGDTTALNLGAAAIVSVTGTETVHALVIDGVEMPAGTYGAGGSGASTIDARFTGSGVIAVTTGPSPAQGYAGWATTHAPTGGPADDYDGDGVPNAVEFILGGGKDTNDLGKLPAVTSHNGNFVVTFTRDQASKVPQATVAIQVGTTLASWPLSFNVDTAAAPEVTITDNGNGTETITLTLAQTPDPQKFARLAVTID